MSTASQTSYQYYMNNAYPGTIADLTPDSRIDSFLNDTGLPINFGLGVVRSITDYDARLPDSISDIFLGVTVRDLARENTDYASTTYLSSEVMSVLRAGRIYVVCETPVNIGDPVFCRFSVAGDQQFGTFRNDDDGVTCFRVQGASFDLISSNDPVPCIIFQNLFIPAPPPGLLYLFDNFLSPILDNMGGPIITSS